MGVGGAVMGWGDEKEWIQDFASYQHEVEDGSFVDEKDKAFPVDEAVLENVLKQTM